MNVDGPLSPACIPCSWTRPACSSPSISIATDDTAYRRDRSKDLLLQENGWIVMRVLADDIAEKFDDLLDCVLRLLVARECHWMCDVSGKQVCPLEC